MRNCKLVRVVFAMIFSAVSLGGLPARGSGATPSADAEPPAFQNTSTSPTSLGVFSINNEGYAGANALTVLYGVSSENDPLISYYSGPADMSVVSLGGSRYEIVETLGGRCMTDNGLGSTITITTCTGSSNQIFSLQPQPDGSYIMQSTAGTCITSPGAGTATKSQNCDSSLSQDWTVSGVTPLNLATPISTTATTTTSNSPPASSGSTTTASPSTTSPATTSPATTSPAATSSIATATSLGVFSIDNEGYAGANALTVLYGVSSENDPLISYYPGPADMNVVSLGNSQYEIVETLGGRCMTDNGLGSTITITTCAGSSNQIFSLQPQPDGSYIMQSATRACVTSPGAGTAVEVQNCNSSLSQNWIFSGAAPISLSGVVSSSTSSSVPAGYHLTFDDEFQSLSISDANGTGKKWYSHTIQCCLGDSASPPAPTFMAGLSDGPGKNPYSLIPGEGLDIRLQKTNGAWYSGVLATVDGTGAGFSQQYGYFEMKANFPTGPGTWPAFWLLNSARLTQNAPSGEIDIVEAYMQFPTIVDTTLHDWSNNTSAGTNRAPVTNMSNGFHTYGMLWTASTMTFYFDGNQIWQTATPGIMNQPYYPIIDLGLGGGWPTDQTPQQSDMIVQYVRVYAP